jgi:hypothetical protein
LTSTVKKRGRKGSQNLEIMAKQKGILKIKGSLGGLTFYEKDGENIVRTTGGVDKERIKNDPAYKRTRENMSEFGASAKVGKALRMGLANVIKLMGESSLVGRLTGLMKKINTLGSGDRGQRSFEILTNKEVLTGFELKKSISFGSIFFAPFGTPVLNANRGKSTWTIPDFNTDNFITKPEGASHFRLLLIASVLSNYTYQVKEKGFSPVHPVENEKNTLAMTTEIPLGGMVGGVTTLTADLGITGALPANVAVLSSIGIIFYQQINSQFYELSSNNAMRIEAVG